MLIYIYIGLLNTLYVRSNSQYTSVIIVVYYAVGMQLNVTRDQNTASTMFLFGAQRPAIISLQQISSCFLTITSTPPMKLCDLFNCL
jgi:type IV secretory pathway VirB3-like protein